MSRVETLASHLQAALNEARESLGLPAVDLSTPDEMLTEAARLSELVTNRMQTIEDQLGGLDVTRAAVRGYLAGEATLATG